MDRNELLMSLNEKVIENWCAKPLNHVIQINKSKEEYFRIIKPVLTENLGS